MLSLCGVLEINIKLSFLELLVIHSLSCYLLKLIYFETYSEFKM
jgi:hypothetical protein